MPEFLLSEDIALRSYDKVLFCYYRRGERTPHGVSREMFSYLLFFDGQTDLEEDETVKELLHKGIIRRKRADGETLKYWQNYKYCDNEVTPSLNLEITQRCNCNCLHCFNATGSEVPKAEMSFEEIVKLLDAAYECGIFALTITGGEPLIRKDFLKIMDAIYDRGMGVFEINTNGAFLTKEILEHLRDIGSRPEFKISFDGIGFHDTMRGVEGMEKRAVDAIKLCVSEGFPVTIQMNVNKKNLDEIYNSICYMDELGAAQTRLIRTVETPRWAQSNSDETLSWEEYYDFCLWLIKKYCDEERAMSLNLWQFAAVFPKTRAVILQYDMFGDKGYREDMPVCRCGRGMPAISANGNIYPCLQMTGYFDKHGMELGNVFRTPLQELLKEGRYHDFTYFSVGERVKKNPECASCKHLETCGGGCPALGLLYSGKYECCDRTKCILFDKGVDEKITELVRELGYNIVS